MKSHRTLKHCSSKIFFNTLFLLIASFCSGATVFAIDTDGSTIQVDPAKFRHSNLTKLTWTAQIFEYDYLSRDSSPYRLRIDFNAINLIGQNGAASFGAGMIQNTGHRFPDDAFTSIGTFPELGLYFSSLQLHLPDNQYGIRLLADPTKPPLFGRCFQNIDGGGKSGKNIYSRMNVGNPLLTLPVIVKITITKGATVTNPTENLSRDINGNWVPLIGTFTIWRASVEINGVAQDVADFYLPTDQAEFINGANPLTFFQEHFGTDDRILQAQKCTVRFVDMRASDETNWFDLQDWIIVHRIDDKTDSMNLDNRFGWKTDGVSLTSSAGHEEDVTDCVRDVNAKLHLSTSRQVPVTGGSDRFNLNLPTGYQWSAVSNATDWLSITSGATGSGSGTVGYLVLPNPLTTPREGKILVAGQTIIVKQAAQFTEVQMPRDFNTEDWLLEDFGGASSTVDLNSIGVQSYQSGTVINTGPVFTSPLNFGYVMLDQTRNLLLLHAIASPNDRATSVGFVAPQNGTYTITGAFARANNSQNGGDGVDVSVIKNFNTAAPLFQSHISSNHVVNADDPFSGTGVATFTITAYLNQGEVLRFANAAGTSHDASFDLTALRFTIKLNTQKATPVLTWSNPAAIPYGTTLGGTQLNATANVAGSFVYTPPAGRVLNAGNGQMLSVLFTPTDTANYDSVARSVTINVLKAPLTVTVNNAFRSVGIANPPFSGTITGLKNNDVITLSYNTTATINSAPGDYPITAMLNDPGNRLSNYQVMNTPGTLKVSNSCGIATLPLFSTQGTVGQFYYQSLNASPLGIYMYSLFAGNLPPGLQLVSNFGQFALQGTPTTRGTYTFTLLVKRTGSACEAISTQTLTIR